MLRLLFLLRTYIDAFRVNLFTAVGSRQGQGLAEYALILALIAIIAIVALIFLGGRISTILSTVGKSV